MKTIAKRKGRLMMQNLKSKLGLHLPEPYEALHARPALYRKLIAVVVIHALVVIANIVTFIIAIPLFVFHFGILGIFPAILCMTVVYNLAFQKIQCPATDLENKIRIQLGLPPIKKFIKHYVQLILDRS